MKKNILLLICLPIIQLYCMEVFNNSHNFVVGKTKIEVIHGLPYQADNCVDLICIGKKLQDMCRQPNFGGSNGTTEIFTVKSYYYENSIDENEEYRPYKNGSQIYEKAKHQEISTPLIAIKEPFLFFDSYTSRIKEYLYAPEYWNDCYYANCAKYKKGNSNKSDRQWIPQVWGSKALDWAKDDLDLCYTIVLDYAAVNKKRKIALEALSTRVGLPEKEVDPVAIKSVLEFINKQKAAFDLVLLYTFKKSQYDNYNRLLREMISSAKK